MNDPQWTAVDDYLVQQLLPPDAVLDAALKASGEAGLPPISVTPSQGKLLMLLAQMVNARSILEIGTLAGYSTIWLARGLAWGGEIITLELEPKHADVAKANFARAGLSDVIDLRLGSAADILPTLANEDAGPFDLIFIDADKMNVPTYFTCAMKLSRPGSVIIVDNVVRAGAVVDAESQDASVQGIRRFLEMVAAEPRASATAIQTVGSKGYDGFVIIRVL